MTSTSTAWESEWCNTPINFNIYSKTSLPPHFRVKINYKKYVTTAEYHACVVCSKNILKDSYIIEKHVLTHGVSSMKEYRGKLIVARSAKGCSTKIVKYSDLDISFKPPSSVIERKATMQEAMEATRSSCVFSCKECGKVKNSWDGFRRHMRESHSSMEVSLEPEHFSLKRVYHECAVCGKKLLKDSSLISLHVRCHKSQSGVKSYRQFLVNEMAHQRYDIIRHSPEIETSQKISQYGKEVSGIKSNGHSSFPESEFNSRIDLPMLPSKVKPVINEIVPGTENEGIPQGLDQDDESKFDSCSNAETDENTDNPKEMSSSADAEEDPDDPEYSPEQNTNDKSDMGDVINVESNKMPESGENARKIPSKTSDRVLQRRPTEDVVVDDPNDPDYVPEHRTRRQGESPLISEVESSMNDEVTTNSQNQLPNPPASATGSTSNASQIVRLEHPKESCRSYLANECRFQCDKCEESFGSWRELRTHVGRTHKQRYIKCNYEAYAIAKCRVYHECAECGAKVLQDDDIIRLHVLTHGIKNLDDYAKVYEEKAATDQGPANQNLAATEEGTPRVVPKQEPLEGSFTFVDIVDPIAVQVETPECTPVRVRSSSRNSSTSTEIIQRSPTLKRKTESAVNIGVQAKRRMMGEQGSKDASDLIQPEISNLTADDHLRRLNGVSIVGDAEKLQFKKGPAATTPLAPKPARKIDPRVLQLKKLQLLLTKGSIFKCTICGRILIKSTLSDANRHCVKEHSVNIVQYYKMASGVSDGEFVWGPPINISLNVFFLHCLAISQITLSDIYCNQYFCRILVRRLRVQMPTLLEFRYHVFSRIHTSHFLNSQDISGTV